MGPMMRPGFRSHELDMRNYGDHFRPMLEMNQAEVEARMIRVLSIPREPEPDILTDRETAARIQRALFDYAAADAEATALMAISMERGVPIITAIQHEPDRS